MPARYALLADVACCVLAGAENTLSAFGYLPQYRYVAPKQPDWECCSTLAVVPGDSVPVEFTDPKCATQRTYRFAVEVGVCVNEKLTCRDIGACCDLPERFDPCAQRFPSKSAEARFLLGLRYAMERDLARNVQCCLSDALDCNGEPINLRCQGIRVNEQTTVTEGACHIVITVLELSW